MSKLESRIAAQRDAVQDYCERVYERNGYSPSSRTVARALGMSDNTALRRMQELDDGGTMDFELLTTPAGRPSGYIDHAVPVDDAIALNEIDYHSGRRMRFV